MISVFWLALPVIAIAGKIIYDHVTSEDEKPPPRRKTILESNLERLNDEISYCAGRKKVAIIGQPGAGKSTLLKKMTGDRVRPSPVIGVQTDATNWSIDPNCNLLSTYENYVFADVPGYDTSSHPFQVFSSHFPFCKFDSFIFVIHGKFHFSDEEIYRLMARTGKRVSIAKSFADTIDIDDFDAIERDIQTRLSLLNANNITFFSNRTGYGIDAIFNSIRT